MRPTLTLNIPGANCMPWNGYPTHPDTMQHSATFMSGSSGWNKSTSSPFAQSPWLHKQWGHGGGLAQLKILHKIESPTKSKVKDTLRVLQILHKVYSSATLAFYSGPAATQILIVVPMFGCRIFPSPLRHSAYAPRNAYIYHFHFTTP
jgi:hypothetical protein